MDLKTRQKDWELLGQKDAMWAVLTDEEHRGNRWGEGDFFRTGKEQIEGVLQYLQAAGAALRLKRALDFGCGVGRLTQALADHFESVSGVDIAESMIQKAKQFNRHGDRCHYYVNASADLKMFPDQSFDFLYSFIVLQHIEPQYIRSYLTEFARVLAPGGILLFQLPASPKGLLANIKYWLRLYCPPYLWVVRSASNGYMGAYGLPKFEVERLLLEASTEIVDVRQDDTLSKWVNYTYCAKKSI